MTTAQQVYSAVVLDIIDGDTAKFAVRLTKARRKPADLGFHVRFEDGYITVHESMRFLGINAAEHGTAAGDAATAYLRELLPLGLVVLVKTVKNDQQEKYGRFLATVMAQGTNINQAMVDAGHAKPWDGKGVRPT